MARVRGRSAAKRLAGRRASPYRAGTPAPNRGSQHVRPGSRYRKATGSALSAFPRPSGTIRPCGSKAFAPALHRRQGVESGRRPGCAHMLLPADAAAHRRGCAPVFVRQRLLASTARLQTLARGPAAATRDTRVRSPMAPAGPGSNPMCKNLRHPHDKTGPRSPTQRAGTPD